MWKRSSIKEQPVSLCSNQRSPKYGSNSSCFLQSTLFAYLSSWSATPLIWFCPLGAQFHSLITAAIQYSRVTALTMIVDGRKLHITLTARTKFNTILLINRPKKRLVVLIGLKGCLLKIAPVETTLPKGSRTNQAYN